MKKIFALVIAIAMVLSLVTVPAIADTRKVTTSTETMTLPRESTRDAANLNEALNVPGGNLVFTSEGTYPWVVDGDAAKSSNEGVASSVSEVSTTVTAVAGDIVQFDFKAWGEGSYTFWDHCDFAIDGTVVFTKGAYKNTDWEAFATDLTAGSHTLTWSYTKDSSVNPEGDYFAVDNVYVGQPVMAESITVNPVTVPAGRRATVSYQVLPAEAYDKSVTFSTANTAIATVDANGVVTGVAEGTTTITVTSAAVPTVSGTATVTVTEALPTVNLEGFLTYDMAQGGLDNNWVGFADYDPSDITVLGSFTRDAWAGAFAGGNVYGYIYTDGGPHDFYILDTETYTVSYPGTTADNVGGVLAMAFNHANQTMYGLTPNDEIVTVDLATGVPSVVATLSIDTWPLLAIDQQGNAYTITNTGDLYAIDLTNGAAALVGSTGISANYVQDMTYDFTTDMIYWAQIYSTDSHGLYAVNPQTAAAELLGAIGPGGAEVTALYIKNNLPIDPIEVPDVTVTFVDGLNNAVLGTQTVEAGTVLDESTFPTAPEHEGYIFTGWDYNGAAIFVDTTITAMYQDPNATIWDFETDPIAQGFEFVDQDGDGYNWGWDNSGNEALLHHEGIGFAVSESYVNNIGALTPDNWMITPQFTGTSLSFWAQGQDPSWAAEYLGVFVSTDGGSSWSNEIAGFTLTGSDTQYTVDLSAYANVRTPIKVAIRHYNVTDMFRANVDYIEVSGGGDTPPVTPVPPTEPPVTPDPVTPEPGEEGLIAGYYFENGAEGWTFNGTANTNWVLSDNNPGGYDYAQFAHEGSSFIMSYSFIDYVGAYQADNWAISPAVTLPSGSARVSFYANHANVSYPEAFDIYIGTSADTSTMTLFQSNVSPNTSYDDPWTHYEFDLSAYAGQTIYLAFYDHCYDMYEIWIDQVEFFGQGGDTPPVTPVPPTEPPVTPEPVTPEPGEGIIWDFEQDPIAQGFEFVDQDGDGYNWEWVYPASEGLNYHEGLGFAASASYDNYEGVLYPDNWMITPEFSGTQLTFWAQGQDSSWAAEYLGIFVSTDGGSSWSNEIANFTTTGSDTQYTVDLSAYAGQTIRVAIRHYNVSDMFRVNVDYIEVLGGGQPPVPGIIGDTNLDGQVTTADAILALRHIMGLETLTGAALEQADGNLDGNVTIEDCILILRAALGLIVLG